MLETTRKAAVIHPTGTGKSFIGFKLCEDNPAARVCWLSPSEYIFNTQIENLKKTGASVPNNIFFYTYSKLTFMTDDDLADIAPDFIILDEFHRCGAEVWGESVGKLLKKINVLLFWDCLQPVYGIWIISVIWQMNYLTEMLHRKLHLEKQLLKVFFLHQNMLRHCIHIQRI